MALRLSATALGDQEKGESVSCRERPRVVIAQNDELVLADVQALLTSQARVKVVATAMDGDSIVECIRVLNPEIAILDIDMPHINGLEVLRIIEGEGLKARVIFLMTITSYLQANSAVREGAWGVVLKHSRAGD